MPTGTGLGVGKGIAQGLDNFFRSYYMATQHEDEQKRNKNAPVLQLIMSQIQDDDVPFSQRQALIDRIPELMGIKLSQPLSKQLNLDQLNQTLVDTGTSEKKLNVKEGTTEQSVIPDSSGPQVTENVGPAPEVSVSTQRKFLKRGDVTPSDLKRFQKNVSDERDFNQSIALTKEQLRLKAESDREELKAKGWQKTGDIFYDKDKGLYFEQWSNPFTQETRRVEFPKNALPKSTVEKQITSSKPSGRFGQLQMANTIIQEYEADNTSHSYADYLAAKQTLNDFEKTGKVKDAQIKYLTGRNAGESPIQPAQQETFTRQDEEKITQAEEKATENDKLVEGFQSQIATYLPKMNDVNMKMAAIRARNDNKEPTLEDEPEDYKEYQALQKQLDSLNDDVKSLNTKITEAQAKSTAAKKLFRNAELKSLANHLLVLV
jgi:hypothetical protein